MIGLPLNFSSPISKPESRQLCLTFHKGAYLNGNTEEDNCDSNPESMTILSPYLRRLRLKDIYLSVFDEQTQN